MKTHAIAIALCSVLVASTGAAADQTFRPFVVASRTPSGLAERTAGVLDQLTAAGFEVAGQYTPLPDTHIIVVTSDALKAAAGASDKGGYAAGQRIGISQSGEQTEVTFVNPVYIQHAYRLDTDMQGIYDQLSAALGNEGECGADGEKMSARKLAKYNYMMGMQQFDDPYELGSFDTHEAAVTAVERGLSREGDGLTQIYRIDIPGKDQVVFGVGMKATGEDDEDIDEAYQMSIVDFEGCRKRAYLPYELLVDGADVEALHMRFRMAVHFPNLSMMGKHGFTKLMPVPGAIKEALENAVKAP